MAFTPHNIRDAEWGSYIQIPLTDTDYPAVTARITDTPMFAGTPVVTDSISYRYAVIVEDRRLFSSTSTVTEVTADTTSALLLAATPNRKGYKISNISGSAVYVLEENNGTASAAHHTATIHAVPAYADIGGYYESQNPVWTGEVHVYSGSSADLIVTEYT